MAFTSPNGASLVGDATIVRHVFIPDLGKSYLVWAARTSPAGYYIYGREHGSINYSSPEFVGFQIYGPFTRIDNMTASYSGGDLVLYVDDSLGLIKKITYDITGNSLVSGPDAFDPGKYPSSYEENGATRVTYVTGRTLNTRVDPGFTKSEVFTPSLVNITGQDTESKSAVPYVAKYAGEVVTNAENTRSLAARANSQIVLDSRIVDLSPGSYGFLDAVSGEIGDVYDNVVPNYELSPGVRGFFLSDSERFSPPFGAKLSFTQEVLPTDGWAITVRAAVPERPVAGYILALGTSVKITIHVDGSATFYTYGLGVAETVSSSPVSGAFHHYMFTKHSDLGQQRIYVDGVKVAESTNMYTPVNPYGSVEVGGNGLNAYGCGGGVAEVALFAENFDDETAQHVYEIPNGGINLDEWPSLLRYFRTSLSAQNYVSIVDLSANGNNLDVKGRTIGRNGLLFGHNSIALPDLQITSGVYIEAWVRTPLKAKESFVLRSSVLDFGYTNEGKLFFTIYQNDSLYTVKSGTISLFEDGLGKVKVNSAAHGLSTGAAIVIGGANGYRRTYLVTVPDPDYFYIQDTWDANRAGSGDWRIVESATAVHAPNTLITPGKDTHVSVSHIFGDGASTFVDIDGEIIDLVWEGESGYYDPGISVLSGPPLIALGNKDYLLSINVESDARTKGQVEDYVKGRA